MHVDDIVDKKMMMQKRGIKGDEQVLVRRSAIRSRMGLVRADSCGCPSGGRGDSGAGGGESSAGLAVRGLYKPFFSRSLAIFKARISI